MQKGNKWRGIGSTEYPLRATRWTAAAAILTLSLFASTPFFHHFRLWGFRSWAYFPGFVVLLLLLVGLTLLAASWRYSATEDPPPDGPEPARDHFALWSALVIIFMGLLFCLLRAKTHFLGDGYLHLSALSRSELSIRIRELGESLVHIWIASAIGGDGARAALWSYQGVSIGAGLLFLVIAAATARMLYDSTPKRLLFLLGLASGGYMLLFFGYVEHYSLLCVAILLFCVAGIKIARGEVNRWLILVPLGLAVFLHVLGLTLVPAAFYLLVRGTRLSRVFDGHHPARTAALLLLVGLGLSALFVYLYANYYFFRFAFVPFSGSRFVLEGYTMFSGKHVLDYANLLFVLFPGVIVVLVALPRMNVPALRQDSAVRFLFVTVISCLAVAFVLDPRLGMPRDWDLLSFPGVPLVVLCYYALLHISNSRHLALMAGASAVMLGFLSLIPRAVAQHKPSIGETIAKEYMALDVKKNRTGMVALSTYYYRKGEMSQYRNIEALRETRYPEEALALEAQRFLEADQPDMARPLARRVIAMNPAVWEGWLHLGRCYLAAGQFDSAKTALRIANGLNPHNFLVMLELGRAYYTTEDLVNAERYWRDAVVLDTTHYLPFMSLARTYQKLGSPEKYAEYLELATRKSDVPAWALKEAGDYYVARGNYRDAAVVYLRALSKGLDRATLEVVENEHPALRDWLARMKSR